MIMPSKYKLSEIQKEVVEALFKGIINSTADNSINIMRSTAYIGRECRKEKEVSTRTLKSLINKDVVEHRSGGLSYVLTADFEKALLENKENKKTLAVIRWVQRANRKGASIEYLTGGSPKLLIAIVVSGEQRNYLPTYTILSKLTLDMPTNQHFINYVMSFTGITIEQDHRVGRYEGAESTQSIGFGGE